MYTTPKIHYNFFQNTNYGILASSVNSVFINWNSFTTNQTGISVIQVPNAYVNGNYLFSTQALNTGIFFNNSNGYIRQNVINGYKRGISLANSSPKIGENQILLNKVNGIYASSGSVPDLRLFLGLSQTPGCTPYYYALSGCNEISDNGGYTQFPMEVGDDGSEIYLAKSSILLDIGNNKIYDDREEIPPLYHTLLLMNGSTIQDEQIMARYNWWGFREVSRERFGTLSVIWEPIGADDCPVPPLTPCSLIVNGIDGMPIDTLYPVYDAEEFSELDEEMALANKYYLTGDYDNADMVYANVVEEYPDSIQAIFAGSQLFTIKKIQNAGQEDFTALQNFYNTYAGNVSDTLLVNMIENLITLCYIGKEEYETAIGRLEDIIVQNPGEEEAIYAEIDAITAAMLANGGGGNLGKYSGKFATTSLDEYGSKIGELMAKLGSSGSGENKESIIPVEYKLYQNYPNPFNPVTTIKYDMVKAQDVRLAVYDIIGREVAVLVNTQQQPGSYEVSWDASSFASGIYFYTLTSGNFTATKKLILLK
jgi:tetratricopeptide (TPR) repeat protein